MSSANSNLKNLDFNNKFTAQALRQLRYKKQSNIFLVSNLLSNMGYDKKEIYSHLKECKKIFGKPAEKV